MNNDMNNNVKTERNSAFEIMRLVAMFMIVWGHFAIASAQNKEPYLGAIDNIGWMIGAFTVCAVNLFFLLTGYYAKADYKNRRKVITNWAKTVFYSISIAVIISVIRHDFDVKNMLGYLFPILTKKYWYMQVYVVLALLSPYIVSLLDTLDNKKYFTLICILLVFFSIHETFIKVAMTLDQSQGYGIIWAIVMFIIGNYIKRYGKALIHRINKYWYLLAYIICSLAIFTTNYLIVKYEIAGGVVSRGNFYAYNSLSVFLQSLFLFLFFVRLSESEIRNRVVNMLGKNSLAVYLVSAHPLIIFAFWTEVIKMDNYCDKWIILLLVSAILTLAIVVGCIILDMVICWLVCFALKYKRIEG